MILPFLDTIRAVAIRVFGITMFSQVRSDLHESGMGKIILRVAPFYTI
jgi:hypothetical protein